MSECAGETGNEHESNVVDSRSAGATPDLTQADLEDLERHNLPEAQRLTLGRRMRAAAISAETEPEYFQYLEESAVSVEPTIENGKVVGYSVALGDTPERRSLTASDVDRQLEIDKLRKRGNWEQTNDGEGVDVESVGPLESLEEAAEQVRELAERVSVESPEQLGALAADVSGIYAVISNRLESGGPGPASAASDTLARTANVSPRPAGRSELLSRVAVMAATAKLDGPIAMILLLAKLSELVDLIAEQHEIRGELQRSAALAEDQQRLIEAANEVIAASQGVATREPAARQYQHEQEQRVMIEVSRRLQQGYEM